MLQKYQKDNFEKVVKESKSIAEVCRKLSLKDVGGNYGTISKYINMYNIDTSHFTGQTWNVGLAYTEQASQYSIDEILENKIYICSSNLKNRLFRLNIKEEKCECCGATNIWNGKPLTLELHHKNGNHYDNSLENLQILCPNCHSQTKNYRKPKISEIKTKNKKAKNHICICKECGKEFYSNRTDKTRKFCSIDCYHKHIKKITFIDETNKLMLTADVIQKITDSVSKCNNLTELSNIMNVSRTTLRKWLKEIGILNSFKEKYNFHSKSVIQYDKEGNIIKVWDRLTDAKKELNIKQIYKCCNGKIKTCGGYIWKYKEDVV